MTEIGSADAEPAAAREPSGARAVVGAPRPERAGARGAAADPGRAKRLRRKRMRQLRRRALVRLRGLPHEQLLRLRRASLARLPRGVAPIIAVGWVVALAAAVAHALVPQDFSPRAPGNWPVAVLIVLGGAALAALVVIRVAARAKASRPRMIGVVVALGAYPVITTIAARVVAVTVAVLLMLVLAIVLSVVRPARPNGRHLASIAILTAAMWLAVLLQPLRGPLLAQYPLLSLSSLGFAALLLLDVSAVRGVAGLIQGRHERTVGRISRRRSLLVATGAVVLAAVVVLLRETVLRGLYGAEDAQIWSPRGWLSWPHAVLTAVLFVILVARAQSVPLTRHGERGMLSILTISVLSGVILAGAFEAVQLLHSLVSDTAMAVPDALFALQGPLQLLTLLAGVGFLVRSRYRASVGRVAAAIALTFQIPLLVAYVTGISSSVHAFWATATQVTVVLVIISALALIQRAVFKTGLAPHTIARMALVPVIAVHAIGLIPAALTAPLGRWTVVLGVLIAVLYGGARVAADPLRRTRDLSGAASTLLGGMVGLLASTAFGYSVESALGALADMTLSLPIAVGLCCALRPKNAGSDGLGSGPSDRGGRATRRRAVLRPST